MANGPSLIIRLGVSGLAGVQQAFARVESMASGIGASLSKLAVGAAAAIGIGLSAHKLVEGVEKVVELGSELSVLSGQTSVSVAKLVAFKKALKEAGADAGDLGKHLRLMTKSIGEAALNGGAAAAGIERLGLNVGELAAMSPDEQFVVLAQRIGAIENPTIRAATALDIFGRSGTELLPIFNNPDILQGITEGAGAFGEVMERNAHRFHEFELALRRIPTLGTKFFAGVADLLPFDELTRSINDALKAVDFVALGQKVGGFVALAIASWRAGRFGELIALTIEAGFEAGGNLARHAWDRLLAWLASPGFWAQLAEAVLATLQAITKGVVNTFAEVLTPVVAYLTWAADRWRFAFESVWELFKQGGAAAINWVAERLETVLTATARAAKAVLPGWAAVGTARFSWVA